MIWLIFTLMIGAAAAFAAAPLLTSARSAPREDARARSFARQIAEIEREADDGAMSEAEAAALKTEAARRLIRAGEDSSKTEPLMMSPKPFAAIAIAAIVAATGGGLYLLKGSPQAPSAAGAAAGPQTAPAAGAVEAPVASVDSMIDGLKTRLEANPENAEGWRMLGWSYFSVGRYKESAEAYGKAVALAPGEALYQSAYGEAQVMAASGFVTPAALKAFDAAISAGADDPRPRFFKGLAMDQSGDPAGAIDAWIELANSAPEGADWKDGLVQRIKERSAETGVDISGRLKSEGSIDLAGLKAPQPSQEQVEAAMAMPSDDRQAMIEGMVARLAARLAADPNDAEGWIRLIKSRTVLGDGAAAKKDLESALAAFKSRPEESARIAQEARALGVVAD